MMNNKYRMKKLDNVEITQYSSINNVPFMVYHEFDAVFDSNSKVLILGSMPSVKSREYGFYYMHPQNRFWKVISEIFDEDIPDTIEDKKLFLYNHKIALWDVLSSCEIVGSSDSTIKNPVVNDIMNVINKSKIETIFVTGKKALELYNKYIFPNTSIEAFYLPSTSPANRIINDYDLKKEYQIILKYL